MSRSVRSHFGQEQPNLAVSANYIQQQSPGCRAGRERIKLSWDQPLSRQTEHVLQPKGWMVREPRRKLLCALPQVQGSLTR